MKDLELESRLQDYYATFTPADSGRVVAGVDRVVAKARARSGSRFGPRFGALAGPRWLRNATAIGLVAVVAVAVAAPFWLHSTTGPAPTSSASASPTSSLSSSMPSSTPSALVKRTPASGPTCPPGPVTTSYDAAGWLGTRFVVVADHQGPGCIDLHQELISVDPAVGQWRTDSKLPYPGATFVDSTDGSSIAMNNFDGILIIDAAGKQHLIVRPTGTGEDFGFYGLPVLPGGGYLVTGGDKLYRIASDGSGMKADPLPSGYVAVAPTSDPNRFILTPAEDANVAYGLVGTDFRAYLWDLRTGNLKLVASSVSTVDRSPDSLAYLSVSGGWASLAADGSTKPVTRPAFYGGWNSPDGSRYIYVPDPSSTAVQTVELRETSTNRALASIQVVIGAVVWKGNVATLISGSELVILDGSTVTRVPLP